MELGAAPAPEQKKQPTLNDLIKMRKPRPRRCGLYGLHGVGKSTWASNAPSPIFIQTEDGGLESDVAALPVCENVSHVIRCLDRLIEEPHEFKTVVIDTVDWLERMIQRHVAAQHGKEHISAIEYGRGFAEVADYFEVQIISRLEKLNAKGMTVVLLMHSEIKSVKLPDLETFDHYQPRMHRALVDLVSEWVDELLFACFAVHIKSVKEQFSKEGRKVAVGGDDRIMRCTNKAFAKAKNRLQMPDELPLEFPEYQKYWRS